MTLLLLLAAIVGIALLAGLAWACLACGARADRRWDALMRERER